MVLEVGRRRPFRVAAAGAAGGPLLLRRRRPASPGVPIAHERDAWLAGDIVGNVRDRLGEGFFEGRTGTQNKQMQRTKRGRERRLQLILGWSQVNDATFRP